jgi:hypothetical protein
MTRVVLTTLVVNMITLIEIPCKRIFEEKTLDNNAATISTYQLGFVS